MDTIAMIESFRRAGGKPVDVSRNRMLSVTVRQA